MNEIEKGKNYFRNLRTSRARTVRIEVVGEIDDRERHFLDGIALFTAGTLSRNDIKHTNYVSDLMTKLIKHIVAKLRKDKKDEYGK